MNRELAAILGCIALVGLIVGASVKEQMDWERFAREHYCEPVEYMKGGTVTSLGITSDGTTAFLTSVQPDKVAYLCDDGRRYWR